MVDPAIAFFGGPRAVRTQAERLDESQQIIDRFHAAHGPCCAGCDHWRWHNTLIGECLRTAPVASADRVYMLGITGMSATVGSGHIMTPREHVCGEFVDSEGG